MTHKKLVSGNNIFCKWWKELIFLYLKCYLNTCWINILLVYHLTVTDDNPITFRLSENNRFFSMQGNGYTHQFQQQNKMLDASRKLSLKYITERKSREKKLSLREVNLDLKIRLGAIEKPLTNDNLTTLHWYIKYIINY